MSDPLAIIGGAGAGLGQSLARAFAQNGYTSIGLNRSVPDGAAEKKEEAEPQPAAVFKTEPSGSPATMRVALCF